MKNRLFSVLNGVFLSAFFATAAGASDVVINEIMFHPYHTAAQAEDAGQEWVELFNRGTNTVNLQGWRLSKGVEFTFTNSTLAPGGYLVVAASRTNFLAHYPGMTNVWGDWIGRLSNTDDEVRLLDATGEEMDRVAYADSGDWAVRTRLSADALGLRGWDWLAPQDGGGMTLELINPNMPNEYGQNWSASTPVGGTPGAVNSVFTNNTAPFIQGVSHFPLVPRSTESVTVKARIDDEQTNGLVVTLYYRNANSASPPAFTVLTMFDDGAHGDDLAGDGLFAAAIPALANNVVVEFYVSATDSGARNRTWPAPARNAPDLGGGVLPPESGANALYQVDDSVAYTGPQPYYRMILTETERAFLASIQGSLRTSDAAAHGTFVSVDANSTEEHHSTSYRRRGAGSRGATIPNYRVNFASDHRWKGVTGINLNSQYTHSQVAGSVLSALAGLHAEFQKPVQLRVNNANQANAGSPQFGSFAQQELPDGDYAKNHFPDDSNGNVYRGSSGPHLATLSYLGTDPNSYIANGYSKTSNGAENDWADLISLTDILNNTPDSNYVAAVQQRLNVQQWMIYLAVFTLLDSKETSLGIGDGDDFGMYRGILDPRFQLLGHDFDTVLGQGDTAGNVNDGIFRATTVAAINRFLKRPEFAPIYYRTLTNLLATAFAPGPLGAALDQHLGSWVNAGVIASMKTFSASRNTGVRAQIPLGLTINHGLTVQGGYPRATINTVALSGLANAIETRSVLVNGSLATWSAWNAQWNATATLLPGINRVLVQSLDANGREFDRAYLDVWYDSGAGVNITGDINDDVVWTAAAGPYNVTVSINVLAGNSLTIEPGTTVYVAPGANITVSGSARLVGLGTDTQHIHIGRNPAVAGNWGSLDFLNATADNRLAYVDFDSSGGTTLGGHNAQIHVNNSKVFFDHCTWPSTPVVQYLSFDNSSFIVQNCTFPTYPAPPGPEMLHGVNGIPVTGYGIFRDNYFGHTWGFNDTIDFTGGNRPGAILQIIGNVFDGASDDHLDLDSTDAWIEGNIFMHAHRDPARTDQAIDTASAISGGVDVLGQNPDWTIINNLFYDVDHVFLNKGNSTSIGNGGGRVAFLFNTVAHVARENSGSSAAEISTFNWSDDNIVLPDPALGSGLYAAHNIIYDAPNLHRFYNSNNLTVLMENNIFPAALQGTTNAWTGPGSGNQYLDPLLNLDALNGVAVANVTAAQLRSAFTLRTGSPALGAGFGGRSIGALNPPGLALAGPPPGTNASSSATLTVGPGGTFNWGTNTPQRFGYTAFQWKLDNGPWSAEIPFTNTSPFTNLPTVTLNNLANGPHTFYVTGKNDVGYYQNDPFVYPTNASVPAVITARTWTVQTNLTRLVINEVLAHNLSALQADGQYPDLVELHNAGASPVDLADLSLTDDPARPRQFIFPPGTSLAPGAYLILYGGNAKVPGHLYLGFNLNNTGDALYLYDRPASGGMLLDSVVFGLQLPDLSIGRLADDNWTLCQPTFGAANRAQPVGGPAHLKINEWLAANGPIFPLDFIELYNPDPGPVALGGLALSDSPMSSPRRSVIAPLSYIAAGGWRSFTADGDPTAGADHVNFHLSAEGGWISLADPSGTLLDMVVYAGQTPDTSQGRSPDGQSTLVTFTQPTPGAGNPGQTITITPITTTLLPLNATWRMEASGSNLGTTWRATNYNDAGWVSGAALFYNYDGSGNQPPPIPASSTIPFTNPKQSTVYFRTTFNYSGPAGGAGVNFLLTHILDDGAVLYLNNVEIYRFNFTVGTVVNYGTLASSTVSGAAVMQSGLSVTLPNLLSGTNWLALELHQASLTSSDLAMALQLESQQLVTNLLGTPLLLNEVFTKNNSYTNASGRAVDWVELYNPTTNVVDISGLSLTDDPGQPRRWVFPPGATLGPSGYYVVEFDDAAPYSPFNAGFQLSADSGSIYLFHRPGAGGTLLDAVTYGVQVADLALGRTVPGQNNTWTLTQPTRQAANVAVPLAAAGSLKINEWMPNPAGNEPDWFEIYNPAAQPVALGGLHLTDDLSNPIKHTIRALSFIGAGAEGYVKFIADSDTAKGADHVGFKLANTEAIGLYTIGAVPTQINAITFANAPNGISQGRLPDGGTNVVYFPDSASPEEANWLPLTGSVVINEALTRASAPLEQAIEIRNPGDVDVAVGGWFLSNARKDLKRFLIPAGTVVSGQGFKVFYAAQFNPGNDVPPSFALHAAQDDELFLSVADANGNLTGYRTSVAFGPAASGVSFGRFEKSTGEDFVAMSARTFGVDSPATVAQFRTGLGAANAYPLVGPVVLNEIHYHPPDLGTNDNTADEFIEILNASAAPVALFDAAYPTNTWRLREAVDFNFPAGFTLPAYSYALVVSFDPSTNAPALAAFRALHGLPPGVTILGPWSGKLDNSSEAIELRRPDAPLLPPSVNAGLVPYLLVDRVKYSDSAPWPSAADGGTNGANGVGVSLQRMVALDYGNDPVNWIAAAPTPSAETGPAAGQPPTLNSAPGNLAVAAGSNVTLSVSATGAGLLRYQWRWNGATLSGATNATLLLSNVQPANAGIYSVLVANQWGAVSGGPARLVVQAPPQIAQQPQSRIALVGVDTTFIVTASGGALNYQWRFNGSNLPGATNAALALTNVQLAATGGYDVRVHNGLGAVTSVVATLTVLVLPSITTPPQNITAIIGSSTGFTATATGTAPLSYQWRRNGTNVAGAINPNLNFTNVQPADGGNYTLIVTNVAGSVTSSVVTLTVIVPPTVTVSASDPFASEPGVNPGAFAFSRSGGTAAGLTVYYTVTGSAVVGGDYAALSGIIIIPPGAVATNVTVTALNDAELEGDETVVVTLTAHVDYLIAPPGSATVVIHDDDNAPPLITLLTPTNSQLFVTTPVNVDLTVSASDPNGTVAKVEFFTNGTNKLGESVVAPFDFTWTNAPAGSNTLTARATDNLGATTLSDPVAVVLNAQPVVSIVTPASDASFSTPASISVSALASDADGRVGRVEFYAGATLFATVTNAPFGAVFNTVALGTYPLLAVATDDRGARATSAVVSVTVISSTVVLTDAFASRPSVNGVTNYATGNNTSATRETGEPPAYNSGTKTVWMEWTAPAGGGCTIDLCGSSFDTVLAVYTNATAGAASVSTLSLIVQDDDGSSCGNNNSKVTFVAQPGTVYQVRVEGYSSSSGNIILRLNLAVTTGPPLLVAPPVDQFALLGGSAFFNVGVVGSTPFSYQWRFYGTNLPGATNAGLTLNNVTTNQVGPYSVVVTNGLGSVTSSNAQLAVIEANSEYFRISALLTNNAGALEHYQLTGYDPVSGQYARGGVAVSASQVFVNAGLSAARFAAADLSGGAALGTRFDALVADLRTESVYCFGTNSTGPAQASAQATTLTHLLELHGGSGLLTGNAIPLSQPITLAGANGNNGYYGFFSGYSRVAVVVGGRVWHVALPSGAVANLGSVPPLQHNYVFSWGYWGLVESTEAGVALVYGRTSQAMARTAVPSGVTTNFATFSNLGFYNASLGFSVARSRWYFDHYGSSQFLSGTEVVGFADAQYALGAAGNLPPTVVVAPQNAQALAGGRAAFAVSAVGGGALSYQWRFNGVDVPGALAPGLVVLDVQAEKAGSYSVVITNAFGAVTSGPVALTLALPPVISGQPVGGTVFAGGAVTFTVEHSGDGPFSYYWKFNGSDYAVTSSNALVIPFSNFYLNGSFRVEVRNAVGVAFSSNAALVVLSPPFFLAQPAGRQLLRGMNTVLAAGVDGSAPFFLQWRKDGAALAGATNVVLGVTNLQPSDAGNYVLVATNIYGAVTSVVATLEVLELEADSFAINTLSTNSPVVVNAFPLVSYVYQNGLAAATHRLFLNGYGSSGAGGAAGFNAGDLSGGFGLGAARNGLVSDLRARKVYSLALGTNLIGNGGGSVNALVELDGLTGGTTTNVITLSSNISLTSGSAIFSGYGRIVLADSGGQIYDVVLPGGQMTFLGQRYINYVYAYGFAYRGFGIAECIGTNIWLAHVRDERTIERLRVSDGATETIASFNYLGNYAGNFTLCLPRNRWYFNCENGSQFGGTSQNNLISADATFVYQVPSNTPPSFIDQPPSRFAPVSSTVVLSSVTDGSQPLSYQWFLQGGLLPNQTNASLVLTNVHATAEGAYTLVLSNYAGTATSAVATVAIDYGSTTTNTVALLTLTGSTWRYHNSTGFLSSNIAWTGSNYNDTSWSGSGLGLLAVESSASITPLINTTLILGRTSYYFRAWFNVPTNYVNGTLLRATTMIDDGATIYLNGHQVERVRMPTGSYGPTTFAPTQAPFGGDAGLEYFYWLASTNLVRGSNVIAAEVHQASANSSDIVWGLALDALVPTLNRPPVITNQPVSQIVSNGVTVQMKTGASGNAPLSYQWRFNGTNLPGAITPTLTITNVQSWHAGVYSARVSNPYDVAVSSNASLTVLVPPMTRFLPAGLTFSAPGHFMLNFTGDSNSVVAIETSTNLINWVQTGTITNTTGTVSYDDGSAGDAPYRFYRLRLVP